MRGMQTWFGKVGRKAEAVSKAPFFQGNKLEDIEWPMHQTPGRHTYYDYWTEFSLPDQIKWEIRLPRKYARSEAARPYHEQVEKEVLNFVNMKIKANMNAPSVPLSLNTQVNEIVSISENFDALKPHYETGNLQSVHERFDRASASLEATREEVYQALSNIYDKTIEEENSLNEALKERLGDRALTSSLSISILSLEGYIQSNPRDTGAVDLLNKFYGIANT